MHDAVGRKHVGDQHTGVVDKHVLGQVDGDVGALQRGNQLAIAQLSRGDGALGHVVGQHVLQLRHVAQQAVQGGRGDSGKGLVGGGEHGEGAGGREGGGKAGSNDSLDQRAQRRVGLGQLHNVLRGRCAGLPLLGDKDLEWKRDQ